MITIPSGVYRTRQLADLVGRTGLRAMLTSGDARLLRFGWYEVGTGRRDEVEAVRRGGVLSCVSALRRHGVWVPDHHDLHVRGNSSAVRTRPGPFCREFRRPSPEGPAAVDDLDIAVRHAARCLDDEGTVVVFDSILNKQLMSWDELQYQFRDAPEYMHGRLAKCDGAADSGPETMARLRLRRQNIKLRIQVKIDGLGRVDMLVGKYLIIEIDGWEWHSDRRQFQKDRTRDAIAHELGYYPLRFTYDDIVFDWDRTNARILTAIRAGAHLRSFLPGIEEGA
ncbi:endonuclease domain-containing protein [Gordonia sp. HY285]|uniref:endonuclease domain-containing protein n=1 Tax=Gordonia liuliyuniae TaxID=2911517 RepID=UPI001F3BCA2C|nr:DUF559 domain-containing protein [Gordonia liuliyuniae]MCF8609650.1 endonuclease domain-containing protein [Gordonia liuliyuniae]